MVKKGTKAQPCARCESDKNSHIDRIDAHEGQCDSWVDEDNITLSEKDIVDSLWNIPGQSMDQLLEAVTDRKERMRIQTRVMDKLLKENRVSCLRFTSYAPNLKTTFFYFATEHGRLEIIDNKMQDFCGFQIGHTHDPMGLWEEHMVKALED